eukprot:7035460-Pyramimonas_sp.AAC.1
MKHKGTQVWFIRKGACPFLDWLILKLRGVFRGDSHALGGLLYADIHGRADVDTCSQMVCAI